MLDAEGLWMTIYLDNEGGLFYFSSIVYYNCVSSESFSEP